MIDLTLTFEITSVSNYHFGAGYGKGFNLDSALLREADGAPVLRGSGLAGLLRDGVYRLMELSPLKTKYNNRDEILSRLFGFPMEAKRWHIGSAHPIERNHDDSLFVWRVRIDPRTRRAEPQKLFSQEEGLAGQKFRFSASCIANDADYDAVLDDAALLVAAARNVRQMGRSRRRGLGECVFHLIDTKGIDNLKSSDQSWDEWFLGRFDSSWLHGTPALVNRKENKADIHAINLPSSSSVRVRIVVRLDEPILIAERASAGNQFDTSPYIPGGAVLGTLAGLAAKRCDLANPSTYSDFVAIFLRGGVMFSMLYPAYHYSDNLYPTIPAPLGLMTCKVVPFDGMSQGHGAYPAGVHDKCPKPKCQSRLDPIGNFLVLKQKGPYTYSPGRSSELHIQINEETQRVEKKQLYGYTVLNAGQYFVGELLCADDITWKRLKEMAGLAEKTPLFWRIGKARRRGYGLVTAWLEWYDDRPQTWIQLPQDRGIDVTEPLSLTLLTDAIIANSWGQQSAGFAPEWLEMALGLGPLKLQDAYARTRRVDGFNTHLGLPRWRDTALTAGSVVWFKVDNPPDDWRARLQTLESEGIGLRRNEGFGRVAFNHPVYEECKDILDSAIRLDQRMRLTIGPSKNKFVEQWEKKLEKDLPKERLQGLYFDSLSRWLYIHREDSPEKLLAEFNELGQPSSGLIKAIGEKEYGERSEVNSFQDEGKIGIQAIGAVLNHLREKERGEDWSKGIECLAEWLATLASDKQS